MSQATQLSSTHCLPHYALLRTPQVSDGNAVGTITLLAARLPLDIACV
jgi:hypothetical protein